MSEGTKLEPLSLVDSAPQWKGNVVENWAAGFRGKENVAIEDVHNQYGPLFEKGVKKIEGQRDNVEGLEREFNFLEALKETGVTPEPVLFKTNPDRSEAKLLMKKLEGSSFEQSDSSQDSVKKNFGRVFASANEALEAIHDKGVAVVDINEGTFVINGLEGDDEIQTGVVDFKLAESIKDIDDPKVQERIIEWYSTKDIGVAIANTNSDLTLDPKKVKGIEKHLGTKAIVEHFIGNDYSWQIDIDRMSDADKARYNTQLANIRPSVEKVVRQKIKEDYQRGKKAGSDYLPDSEDEYIKQELDGRMKAKINAAMGNITLPYLLKEKEISVETDVLQYMQKTLSPYLEQRPAMGIKKEKIVNRIEEDGNEDHVLTDIAAENMYEEIERNSFDSQFSAQESKKTKFGGLVHIVDIAPKLATEDNPILVLPGWGENATVYEDSIREMHNLGRRVLCVWHEGIGSDPSKHRHPSIEVAKAKTLLEQLKAKDLKHVDVIAHSIGAISGMIAASDKDHRIDNIVLVDPAGMIGPDKLPNLFGRFLLKLLNQTRELASSDTGKERRTRINKSLAEGAKFVLKHPVQGLAETVATSQVDLLESLKELRKDHVGVSIIHGVDDPVFPMSEMQKYVKAGNIDGFYSVEGGHDELQRNPNEYAEAAVAALKALKNR